MPILNRGLLNSTALTNVSLISAGLMLVSGPAMALGQNTLPQNGQVIGGQATIVQTAPNTLTIDQQSNSAAINWRSFSIGSNATTNFVQPGAGSIAVNRVTGVDPSQIEGHLNANGQVVLVNPNGILFTKSAQVNVGGLVASTSGISEKNAIAGKLVFDQGSAAGAKIVNEGHISAKDGGLVALVAPSVVNNGVITAKLGKVSLAAGDKWTLDLYGDKLVNFAMNDKVVGEVQNSGVISANGGEVQITANVAKDVVNNAINMSGIVEASSVSQQGGTIVLDAGEGKVAVSGKLAANGTTGGTVDVTGAEVALNGATVEASGVNGGGTINVGGEAHGAGTLAHATTVTVDSATKLVANATKTGNGGNVTVWSDGTTKFAGSASAKGSSAGTGGTIETSGHDLTIDGANIDASAASGNNGTWLLDPFNLTINAAGAATIENALKNGSVLVQTTSNSTSGQGSVTSGTGNINVNSSIVWGGAANDGSSSLTLSAYDSINVNANITDTGSGNIVLRADNAASGNAVAGSVAIASGDLVSTGGTVSIYYHPTSYTAPKTYSSAQAKGQQGTTAYMLVDNVADLKNVHTNLSGTYALGTNISGVGSIAAIGNGVTAFTGLFDGNGGLGANYSISGVTVAQSGASYEALFGDNAGTIRNVTLVNAVAEGARYVAGLVGYNSGHLVNDGATNVRVNSDSGSFYIGGLVGYNSSTGFISGGSVTGNVSVGNGTTDGGGFAGANYGTILGGSFTGTVLAGCVNIGGFVGANYGYVSGASATAYVDNRGGSVIGGFAGLNEGYLLNDTAKNTTVFNDASQDGQEGGFVGANINGGSIVGGYASGIVTANSSDYDIGGFAGYNTGVITSSTSDVALALGNNVTNVGGFAGYNSGSISNNNFTFHAISAGTGSTNVGGYVGYNAAGVISGVSITGGLVSVGDGSKNIGGLVGYNDGTLDCDAYTGTVNAGGVSIGGAVGLNFGNISAVAVSGLVTISDGSGYTGGVIGANYGNVTASGFDGTITAGCYDVGGFVGANFGTISDSFATANISNGWYEGTIGGFAGENAIDTISGKTYTGLLQDVAALGTDIDVGFYNTNIGGVVGYNSGTINGAVGTGTVYAQVQTLNVGAFVGYNVGSISNAATDASLHALSFSDNVGGFAGNNGGSISGSQAEGTLLDDGNSRNVGGFIGLNTGTVNSNGITTASINTIVTDATSLADCDCGPGGTHTTTIPIASGGTPTGGSATSVNLTVSSIGSNVGGYIGFNDGVKIGGVSVTGSIFSGDGSTNVGGLVGYNTGSVTSGSASDNVTVGSNSYFVGGGVGANDAGGSVSGLTVSSNVFTGSNVSGVGGIVGINGSDQTDGLGGFGAKMASVTNSTYSGTVTVGAGSFAVGGLIGWNSKWNAAGASVTGSYSGLSGSGVVSSPADGGTTFIHNANQVGCDEGAGGNCFGTAGQEVITVSPNDLVSTYGQTPPTPTYDLSYTVPGQTGTVNGLESGDQQGDVLQVNLQNNQVNAGSSAITGTANINPSNANALLDYIVVLAPTGTSTVNKAVVTVTPTGSQTYGGTNINVSYSYVGLVNGDSTGVVTGVSYTTPVTPSSDAGTYSIKATDTGAANYTVVDGTGVYTVNQAPLTITANDTTRTQGVNSPDFTATFAGLVNGDGSSVVTGLTFSPTDTTGLGASTYPGLIIAANGKAKNYKLTYVAGTLTIVAAPLPPVEPPTNSGTITPIPGQIETVQGQIAGLNSLLQTFNTAFADEANQITCLKVNSEIRGVTTDSPIDCAAPLQVNGF